MEDTLDDASLRRIDLTLAHHGLPVRANAPDHPIPVGIAATAAPCLDAAAQAAMRLGGKVLQEEGVHRALQADMQLTDLAFRQGDDADAGKLHPFIKCGNILLVAGQAVQGFCHDDIDGTEAHSLTQRLVALSEAAGAAGGPIGKDLD